ncbi:MAG: M50 family metallopeptidase [Deltaproteobacteria bacterium]|nr:M50 family metallopeptidase [Deltaproteobacteria bacterium]
MRPRHLIANLDGKAAALLAGLTAAVVLLWGTPVVYPLKILVVLFHEMSHGLAAVLTGGRIVEIQVVAQEGGLALSEGGSRFVTLSAGYLGSLLFGGVILVLASRTRADRALALLLGVVLAAVTLLLVRPILGFGFAFGALCAVALIVSGWKLPAAVNDLLLRVVGLTSCLYAVLDIKSDVLDRPQLQSDAAMLAALTGLPTRFWGALWIVVALGLSSWLVLLACQRQPGGESTAAKAAPPTD